MSIFSFPLDKLWEGQYGLGDCCSDCFSSNPQNAS
ncbi:hypothetical protein BVRB_1g004170 [Beta vulgaris subsp. vulgaris]|nr:hypothetical protein BVRB_1g004170 [Beta vulgaris subsp. vulgaris]